MTTVTLTCDCGKKKLFEISESAETEFGRSYVCPQCRAKEPPPPKQEGRGKLYQEGVVSKFKSIP